jgi:two-component system, NarL family, sensor histidine kinase UhpB
MSEREHPVHKQRRSGALGGVVAGQRVGRDPRLLGAEARYRIIAENTYAWEFWLSPELKFLYCSPSCERITGYTPADFEAEPDLLMRLVHEEDRPRYQKHQLEKCRKTQSAEEEFRITHRDGTERWIGHVCGPLYDEAGRFLGTRGSNRDITQRKQAEAELRSSREELRALAGRLQSVREEERGRVAREIHDVLAQELTRLKIGIAWLSRRLVQPVTHAARKQSQEKLAELSEVTDLAIGAVQKIAAELRPVVLDSLGLCAAIEWQASDFQERTGIKCLACVPAAELKLERERSSALFRILQESLTNVARHAGASRVKVSLARAGESLTLTVRDNGRGIQPEELHSPRAVGLLGIRERALLLGGQCAISGQAGKGTIVEARVPMRTDGSGRKDYPTIG